MPPISPMPACGFALNMPRCHALHEGHWGDREKTNPRRDVI
jgi:hypothetical protein